MNCALQRTSLGNVAFTGRLGDEIATILGARIQSRFAAEEILAEATAAFRNRVDDRLAEGRGQWQGEFWGKWMLSAIAAQRYTGDPALLETIRDSVEELLATQDENGYIGTYADSAFVVGNCWNIWCRKYTLWGLVESYELLGEKTILDGACRFMDHLMTEVGPGAVDMVSTGNFVGLPSSSILTPLMGLYRFTRCDRYLEYARYIVAQWSLKPGEPPDIVNKGLEGAPVHEWFPEAGKWTKAYEFISCVEGLLDLYDVDAEPDYLTTAENIAAAICGFERVITGGIGYHDKLLAAAFRPDGLNEPCDIVYWERLLIRLLELTGKAVYADEIERLTYNALMATANRDGSWGLRRLGLSEPHLIAPLHCQLSHHQCCVANLPRGLIQLAEIAVMTDTADSAVAVNLYIPGTAHLMLASGLELTLNCETSYPQDGKIVLSLALPESAEFAVKLRIPPWSDGTVISVNGEGAVTGEAGDYAVIRRCWSSGDTIEIGLDVGLRAVNFPGEVPHRALMYGPVVLARSEMLGDTDVHGIVDLAVDASGNIQGTKAAPAEGVWLTFDVATADGGSIRLCDYASTGKDHAKPTDPLNWKGMIENRTDRDLRVWLPMTAADSRGASGTGAVEEGVDSEAASQSMSRL